MLYSAIDRKDILSRLVDQESVNRTLQEIKNVKSNITDLEKDYEYYSNRQSHIQSQTEEYTTEIAFSA